MGLAEIAPVASAGFAAVAATSAALNVRRAGLNERKRTQPIVVAHEYRDRRFSSEGGGWTYLVYLTNEGFGPAFNVRFGVVLNGVQYAYAMSPEDPTTGSVQRVLRAGERLPADDKDTYPVVLSSGQMAARASASVERGDLDARCTYWARYENSEGETWETVNPADRAEHLTIAHIEDPVQREHETAVLRVNDENR